MCNDEIEHVSCFLKTLENMGKLIANQDCEFFFRGQSSKDYELKPSIYRKIKDKSENYVKYEDKFFKEIISINPVEFVQDMTTIEKLIRMQHYGIPTRLLDITSNPLVALYFACKSKNDRDGQLFIFKQKNENIKFYDDEVVTILSNLAKMPKGFSIKKALKKANKDDNISRLLHQIKNDDHYFISEINKKDFNKVIYLKAKNNNNRVIRQSGAFLLFGINEEKDKCAKISPIKTINIPMKSKSTIMSELSNLGISKKTLFPDLENQGEYLKELYV